MQDAVSNDTSIDTLAPGTPTASMPTDDPIISAAIQYVSQLFAGNAGGHDVQHTMRVYRNALLIAQSEPGCDLRIVALSALLHDADDHKLFNTRDNANARAFLATQDVDPVAVERICEVINGVSFSQNKGRRPGTLEGMVVQDADRLDALGAIGIARTFAFGGEHGRSLESSVQHFYDKLLLLRDQMNTPTARALADQRHAVMQAFLDQLYAETGMTPPV